MIILLLVIPLQVFDIPRTLKLVIVQQLQVVASLLGIVGDFVGAFPGGAKFSMSWVLRYRRNFPKDEVPYVESPKLYSLVAVS